MSPTVVISSLDRLQRWTYCSQSPRVCPGIMSESDDTAMQQVSQSQLQHPPLLLEQRIPSWG